MFSAVVANAELLQTVATVHDGMDDTDLDVASIKTKHLEARGGVGLKYFGVQVCCRNFDFEKFHTMETRRPLTIHDLD